MILRSGEECLHGDTCTICVCDLVVGRMEIRGGNLCSTDDKGHLYLRAPRGRDAKLAQRLVAAMEQTSDGSSTLAADVTSVRETG